MPPGPVCAMYGLQSSFDARVLLEFRDLAERSAAETYQNFRRESSERFRRLPPPFPRLGWVVFAFRPALVLRAIAVRSASGERANQAAPRVRAA